MLMLPAPQGCAQVAAAAYSVFVADLCASEPPKHSVESRKSMLGSCEGRWHRLRRDIIQQFRCSRGGSRAILHDTADKSTIKPKIVAPRRELMQGVGHQAFPRSTVRLGVVVLMSNEGQAARGWIMRAWICSISTFG